MFQISKTDYQEARQQGGFFYAISLKSTKKNSSDILPWFRTQPDLILLHDDYRELEFFFID